MTLKSTATAVLGLLIAAAPFAAFAEDGGGNSGTGSVSATVDVQARKEHRDEVTGEMKANAGAKLEDRGRERGAKEIDRRIEGLNKLMERIGGAKHIEDGDKSSLSSELSAQIQALTALKAKIDSDTSTTTLKDDLQSITKSYRIFALVMPKGAITAAADRAKTVAGQLETLSGKLKTRLDALSASSTDVSSQLTILADMNAKIADAKVQAQAAIDGVANLQPDNGDATTQASNTAALKAARAKIQTAQQDLKTAREDARKIMGTVKGKGKGKDEREHNASTTHE